MNRINHNKIIFSFFIILYLSFTVLIYGNDLSNKSTRVAIFNFEAKGEGVSKDLAEAVTENLITYMIDSGAFEVIERSQLNKIMLELNLQNSDDFNDEKRKQLGNMYGIELAIFGSVTKIGDYISINARGVEIDTGIAKFAKNVQTDSLNSIPSLISLLVDYIVKANEIEIAEAKKTPDETKKIEEEMKEIEERMQSYNKDNYNKNNIEDKKTKKEKEDKSKNIIQQAGKFLIGEYKTSSGSESETFYTSDVKELKNYSFKSVIIEVENNCVEFRQVKLSFDDLDDDITLHENFILNKTDKAKEIKTIKENGTPRDLYKIRIKFKNEECNGNKYAIIKIFGIK